LFLFHPGSCTQDACAAAFDEDGSVVGDMEGVNLVIAGAKMWLVNEWSNSFGNSEQ